MENNSACQLQSISDEQVRFSGSRWSSEYEMVFRDQDKKAEVAGLDRKEKLKHNASLKKHQPPGEGVLMLVFPIRWIGTTERL